ncbi:MAG: IS91 family transposase [Planctomycetes bacterium]|nr:IS91 family transposase [Planctomycetota bacterium]
MEIADVIRRCGRAFLEQHTAKLSIAQQRVLKELALCRTAALGGHVEECSACAVRRIAYNSCRNRHCPKCQASSRAEWFERHSANLLPVDYHHVVFTLPPAVAEVAFQNQQAVYRLLFAAAWQTLREIAADPKHLGAEIGMTAVLHTWGQTLDYHPHLHCVATGGGLSPDGRWISSKPGFFLPVKVLSRVFRGKLLAGLTQAFQRGGLSFYGRLSALARPAAFAAWRKSQYRTDWVVYSKPPFGGPVQVLKYLARYTHRVAISNRRLVSLADGRVTFRYRDYRRGRRLRTMTLAGGEFLRRFLLHVLPPGFMKVRSYGLLANCHRQEKLACCRELLGAAEACAEAAAADEAAVSTVDDGSQSAPPCPSCGQGRMIRIDSMVRPSVAELLSRPFHFDTS